METQKYIKRDGKIFLQRITEEEIMPEELEFRKKEIEEKINAIKALKE